MAYYKGTSGTFYVETRSLETGLPVTVDASTVSMVVYNGTGSPVSWESGTDYEITSIPGGLMVYVENFGIQNSISFYFSCTDSSVYIPMICIALEEFLVGILSQILTTANNAATKTDIPTPAAIAYAVLTTEFSQYALQAESGTYRRIPLTAEFAMLLAAQGVMNGGLLKSRIVDSLADIISLAKYSKVEISSPSDLVVNTTTEKVEVVSQTVDLTELKTYGDTNWKTAEGFATAADVKASENAVLSEMETLASAVSAQDIKTVSDEIKSAVTNISESVHTIEGYTDELESLIQGVPTSGNIAQAVWSHTSRDLTRYEVADLSDVATSADLKAAKDAVLAECRTATGFATSEELEAAKSTIYDKLDSDLNSIRIDCRTAEGFATPNDVVSAKMEILADLATISTTTNDISKDVSSVYSYVTEISEIPEAVWNYGADFNARTVKANGVSLDGTDLSVQVDSAEIANAVWSRTVRTLTSGDNIDFPEFDTSVLDTLATSAEVQAIADGRKLTDLAVPSDLVVNTTTETVEVVSQTVDLTELKTYGDTNWKTAEGFAAPEHVTAAQSAIIAQCKTASGFATPANITAARDSIISQCRTATGFATPEDVKLTTTTQTVDLTDLKTYGDANWKTADGFARSAELDPKINLLLALIKKWKVVGSKLTAYDDSGNELGEFTLTKNANGQIIEVS